MSDATSAIFISYAREDSVAADRIAEALRSHGIEVWFDQNELRGGEAWDQKIRNQIRTCSLLIPIVSAHTQGRGEGYFRREWKFAAERTHDMAAGIPFLVPVVIDDTAEGSALVPEEFMKVQWTRLPHGRTTPEFAAQVKRLLEAPRAAKPSRPSSSAAASASSPATAAPRSSGVPVWAVAAGGVALLGAVVYFAMRPTGKESASPAKATAEAKAAPTPSPITSNPSPAATKVADKSIAVLPLANMSEDKDTGFFADGVHEDLLTNLALVSELKVVSRTTAMQYRGSSKSMKQIGEELGVAYILEGSVRRSGNKVRVTGQLINARTDEHVWAKSYDRDITDVFAIQASLSQEIASALQAAITPQAQKFMERRPTENPVAYDSFLKGRDIRNRSPTGQLKGLNEAEKYFREAVTADPNFAAAWGELAVAHALKVFWDFDHTPARLAEADAAIGRAVRLAPDAPDVIRSLGTYAYYAYRDYARATEQYEKIARLQPNDPTAFSSLALIMRRQGRWADAINNLRRATELDPANISYARNLYSTLRLVRRWDEAIAAQRRVIALLPDRIEEKQILVALLFWSTGSEKEEDELFAQQSREFQESPKGINWRKGRAYWRRDLAEYQRLDLRQPFYDGNDEPRVRQIADAAGSYFILGDTPGALARMGNLPAEMRVQLANEPANARMWSDLGFMECIRGNKEEALRCAHKPVEMLPEARDAYDGPRYSSFFADACVWTGENDKAIAEYARLLRIPSLLNVHDMKKNPFYAPLRGDPRWEALLADPKSNAPLF